MAYSPNKVDMAQMNAAIDKVLALPAASKSARKKRRTEREVERPSPARSGKTTTKKSDAR